MADGLPDNRAKVRFMAQRRLASLGNRVELEYGQSVDRLFRETIRVILLGLRATETRSARVGTRGHNVIKKRTKST
jgi:hypothetical protein